MWEDDGALCQSRHASGFREAPIHAETIPPEPDLKPLSPEAFRSLSTHASALFGFGFGGAKVVELGELAASAGPGDPVFFGVDTELNRKYGRPNPGAASFIRRHTACMMPWVQAHGSRCHDVGLLASDDPKRAITEAFGLSEYLAGQGFLPVLVGCDHTASMVNVMGASQGNPRSPIYLFLDAHFDLGLHHGTSDLHNGNFVQFLRNAEQVKRIVNVGGRSWSTCSPIYGQLADFECIPGGVHRPSAGQMIEQLAPLRGAPLYVSIDADVLDPSQLPNVCCPEPFGMPLDDLFALCEWLGGRL